MSLPTPPLTGQMPPVAPRPGILRFLDAHLEHGCLDANGHDMLQRVFQMIDEISLLLFPHSSRLSSLFMRRIEWLTNRIMNILNLINTHIDGKLEKAKRAAQELPELSVPDRQRYANLKDWCDVLHTLHNPSKNDVTLYRHFLNHYEVEVRAPFYKLHRLKPEHNSWALRNRIDHIRFTFVSLRNACEEANEIVYALDAAFEFGCWRDGETPPDLDIAEDTDFLLPPIVYDSNGIPAFPRTATRFLPTLDDVFRNLDDDFWYHPFGRPPTDFSYDITSEPNASPKEPRAGAEVPRVFSGPSSQLEGSVKGVGLNRAELSVDAENANAMVKTKDFAVHTPCLLPSPATLLERREALCTRELQWEHRLIGGQVVKSRRPHDRNRAQTVDERRGALEAWLAESPSDKAAERVGGARVRAAHRQNTM